MAVSIHLRAESSGREQVEESRLARTLLNLIAEDLRRVVPYDPQQDTRYKVAWPGISADTGEQFIDPELEAAAAEAGFEADPEALARAAEQTQADLASQPNAAGPAGLYGDSSALQLDTSRLPRIEALQAAWQLTDASVAADALALAGSGGDLKTVTYYLAENGSTGSGTSPVGATIAAMGSSGEGSSSTSWSAGLVRREMDRQKAVFAAEQGLLDVAEQHEQLVAPEVVGLQFRYFDGMEWFDEWDCQAKGGLPVAVRCREPGRRTGGVSTGGGSARRSAHLDRPGRSDRRSGRNRRQQHPGTAWRRNPRGRTSPRHSVRRRRLRCLGALSRRRFFTLRTQHFAPRAWLCAARWSRRWRQWCRPRKLPAARPGTWTE